MQSLQNIVNLDVEKTIQRRRQYLENTKFGYNLFVRVAVAIHHSPLSREIQERLTDVLPAGWKEEHLGQAQIHLRAFVRAAIAVHYCRMTNEGKAEFVAVLPAQHK